MTASIRMRRYGIRVVAEPSGDTSRERLEGLTDKTIHSARNPPPEINREPCPVRPRNSEQDWNSITQRASPPGCPGGPGKREPQKQNFGKQEQ